MINVEKIKYNEPLYYTPSYCGAVRVTILKKLKDNLMLVKQYSRKKDFKPFPIPIEHIYNQVKHAERGTRNWEHYMRHKKNSK